VPEPEFDFFEFGEADRLVAGAEGEWRTMIVLAIKTGLRQGGAPSLAPVGRGPRGRALGGETVGDEGDRDHAEEREVAQDPGRSVGADGSERPPAPARQAGVLRGGWADAHEEREQAAALACEPAGGAAATASGGGNVLLDGNVRAKSNDGSHVTLDANATMETSSSSTVAQVTGGFVKIN
jgi:hypothetical protein